MISSTNKCSWFRNVGAGLALLLTISCGSQDDEAKVAVNPDDREITASNSAGAGDEVFPVDNAGTQNTGSGPIQTTGPGSITDLVLVTGQSNALGAETSYDKNLDSPVDRFYAYTDQGWQKASLKQVWDLGWHPRTSVDTDPHNNFALHFGKTIASRRGDRVVGIVLVTAPGEGINHWDANGYFFNKVRTKALAALNELPHKHSFDGILWHQGETDWSLKGSLDTELAGVSLDDNYYSTKLWQLIDNFRKETWFDHEKPFICGETAQSPINQRLMALNRDNDPWTACVEGEGLPTYDDVQVHFSAEGLRTLGANYAETYLQIAKQPSI